MTQPIVNVYPTPQHVAQAFALFLAAGLRGKPHPAIALSGGSTPKLLFQLLATEFSHRIDWSGVHLFWADERCVPPDDPESNYGVAQQLFLGPLGISAAQIHRIRGEDPPSHEARRYAREIISHVPVLDGLPVFDFMLLGMGEDGHTASIFPDQHNLLEVEDLCAVARHPASGQQRITLTGPVINQARHVIFLVTGKGKAPQVREILKQEGVWATYPASFIRPAKGQLYWFLDQAAAASM